ncbi:helix-turn-helix domain-containing protein [Methylobacterium sp. WL8]|uniref:helix-turn-helix domain-containing protein n=1 Tax=Methylobacterium sp. WL8 TaxID=2603899 RepID=UPI0011C9304D|nr:helix-turn-helix domain-containing protein [Methylobacterium sp. WL8]TXN79287.1 helix-turn-helix domain-containing protein [Methylobacterium sp. WL8]
MTTLDIQPVADLHQTYLSRASIDSFGLYHDMIQSSGATVSVFGDKFEASIAAHHFGRLTLFDRQIIGADHRRDTEQIRRDGFDHFYLQVLRSGQMVSGRSGEERRFAPGDAVLFDATQPMRSFVVDADYVTVILSRELVEAVVPDARHLHGRILPKSAVGSLGETILSLVRCAPSMSNTLASGATQVITSILNQIQGRPEEDFGKLIDENDAELSRRLKAELFIDSNLSLDLNSEFVARSIGVSRASLYRAMQAVGGVQAVITRRRAARLRQLILRPPKQMSINRMAHKVGFASLSHSSRTFKKIYGISPDDLRSIIRDNGRFPNHSLSVGQMQDWYNAMNI